MDKLKVSEIIISSSARDINYYTVKELAKSIKDNGLLHPIAVNKVDGHYHLISGNHRLTAYKELGYETIESIIHHNLSPSQSRLIELSENLVRQDCTVLEKSLGFAEIKKLEETLGIVNKHGGDRKSKDREDKPSYIEKVAQQSKIGKRQVSKLIRVGNELLEDKETIDKLTELRCNDDLKALTKLIGSKKNPITPDERKEILKVAEKKVTEYKENPIKALNASITKVLNARKIKIQYEIKEWDCSFKLNTVNHYDSTKLIDVLPEKSIRMIFTDPLWDDESLYLYEETAKLAEKVLTDNGVCAIYTPTKNLATVMDYFNRYLDYYWLKTVYHPFAKENEHSYPFFRKARYVLIYVKKGYKPSSHQSFKSPDIRVSEKKDKAWHPYQQDEITAIDLMKTFLSKGDIVLEPFTGGGTTLAVAKELGFDYIGFDIDKEAINSTLNRLDTIVSKEN